MTATIHRHPAAARPRAAGRVPSLPERGSCPAAFGSAAGPAFLAGRTAAPAATIEAPASLRRSHSTA